MCVYVSVFVSVSLRVRVFGYVCWGLDGCGLRVRVCTRRGLRRVLHVVFDSPCPRCMQREGERENKQRTLPVRIACDDLHLFCLRLSCDLPRTMWRLPRSLPSRHPRVPLAGRSTFAARAMALTDRTTHVEGNVPEPMDGGGDMGPHNPKRSRSPIPNRSPAFTSMTRMRRFGPGGRRSRKILKTGSTYHGREDTDRNSQFWR